MHANRVLRLAAIAVQLLSLRCRRSMKKKGIFHPEVLCIYVPAIRAAFIQTGPFARVVLPNWPHYDNESNPVTILPYNTAIALHHYALSSTVTTASPYHSSSNTTDQYNRSPRLYPHYFEESSFTNLSSSANHFTSPFAWPLIRLPSIDIPDCKPELAPLHCQPEIGGPSLPGE